MKRKSIYLPDTNIFILGFQKYTPESQFLEKIIESGAFCISTVVISEFLAKAQDDEIMNFEKLMSNFKVLPIDMMVAVQAAQYRKQSLKKKRAELLDCFIAAQAKLNNLTLVTHNKSDFPMKDIKLISP